MKKERPEEPRSSKRIIGAEKKEKNHPDDEPAVRNQLLLLL